MNRRNLCLFLALSPVNATLRGNTNGQSINNNASSSSSRRRLSTITAIHDATIRSDTPYTNYGLDDTLGFIANPTTSHASLDKVESLLKFDLTTLNSRGLRERTFLQLYAGDCNFATLPHANQLGLLQVRIAENNMAVGTDVENWQWEEESVTWFNSPLGKEHGGKMVKSLKFLEEKSWVEIDISTLISSLSTPTLTLRLSSVLFAHSDNNMSLCTFASRNYRDGMFAPKLVTTSGLSSLDDSSTVDEAAMETFSSNVIGIQPQDLQDQENDLVDQPHKIFHTPKLHSKENLLAQTATTEKVTKCAPPYSPSVTYAHNDVASSQNNNYRCKGHPYTVWCSEAEYEPGVSLFWGLAWDLVNACKTEVASIHSKESEADTGFKEPATIIDTPADSTAMSLNSQSSASSSAPLCPDKWNFVYPYTTGDRVTLPSTLIIYECKEQPFGYYCANAAYEVGLEGGVYENAWKPIGRCVDGRVVEDRHYLDGKSDAEHAEEQAAMSQSSSQSAGSNLVRPTALMNTQSSSNVISDPEVPEQFKTNVKCNLCEPGQIGINAEIPIDGGVAMCMDIYEYYLQNFLEGTKQCDAAKDWLNSVCCGDESMMNAAELSTTSTTGASAPPTKRPVTLNPTPWPTPEPITPEPTLAPIVLPQDIDTSDSLASTYSQGASLPECATPYTSNGGSYKLNDRVSHTGGNFVCMMSEWCSESDFEPRNGKYWMTVWEFETACKQPEGIEELSPQQQRPTSFDTDGDSFAEFDQDSEQPPPPPPVEEEPEEPSTVPAVVETAQEPTEPAAGLTDQPEEIVEDSPDTTVVPAVVETIQEPTEAAGLTAGDLPKCPLPWNAGQDYAEGDTVEAGGQIYSCKEFPYNGWCGLDAYEPGLGTYWVDAWDLGSDCVGGATKFPTPSPTKTPTLAPSTATPTNPPMPTTSSPTKDPSSPVSNVPDNDPNTLDRVYSILEEKKDILDNNIFLYQGSEPSSVYRYDGFVAGLKVMTEAGVAGKFYYLGDGSENGYKYGLVNLAAFIGQSMKETIQYDACDENSWDLVDGKYPLSNACGQLGQKYDEYHCSEEEKHMECPVDPNMSIKGVTHAKWYGAPGPLFCGPKTEYEFTGFWDYGYNCNNPWADPPEFCEDYPDQKAGRYDNTEPVANVAGRTDVEGCCWWGRGVIQTTGICNFGKLNYFLGARAAEEGRDARYPDIDFCKDPEAICASEEHKELKWIAGMFYWVESLQSYSERGWDYITELHKFVDEGMADSSFIDGVSGIVNRGCHDPPCGTGEVDGLHERAANFQQVLSSFIAR